MTKKQRAPRLPPVDVNEPITPETYVARACAYIRAHNGEGVVVVSPTAPLPLPQHIVCYPPDGAKWRAWLLYLASKKIPTTYSRKVGFITVPADWPELFDPTAPQSDPFPPALPAKDPDEQPRWIGPALAKLARDMSPWPARREARETDARYAQTAVQAETLAGEAEAALAAMAACSAANPVYAPGHEPKPPAAADPDPGALYPGERFDDVNIPFDGA